MLARTAYKQFGLDEVWIMPNGNPPHKRDIEQTDFEMRCEMIRLAIEEIPYLKLCEVEESGERYHYTYQTLKYFREQYPGYEFYFIIGADSLDQFSTWKEPGKIAGLCTLLVACRDESGIEELKSKIAETRASFGGNYFIMNSPKVDAASKEIREMIAAGEDASSYLDAKVYAYIKQLGLY